MISFNGIGKRYANQTQALEGINLTVADGEILAILGGSGCGKSTLLRLASGLDQPDRRHGGARWRASSASLTRQSALCSRSRACCRG